MALDLNGSGPFFRWERRLLGGISGVGAQLSRKSMQSEGGRGRPVDPRPLDNHGEKKKPNSLVSLFKAVRCRWGVNWKSKDDDRNRDKFAQELAPVADAMREKYKGMKAAKNLPSWMQRIENVASDASEITYFQLRVYSEFCKVPSGLFMLYSHVAALSRKTEKGFGKDFVLSFLDRTIVALMHLRSELASAQTSSDIKEMLVEEHDVQENELNTEIPFDTKIDLLSDMQDIFWNSGNKCGVSDKQFQRGITYNL